MPFWSRLAFLLGYLASPLTSSPLEISSLGPLELVEGNSMDVRVEASGGTGAGFVWNVVQGMPSGLELVWSNKCLSWGGFSQRGEVDDSLPSPALRSVSGMVASWRQPGILWVHDDADSALPRVYAIDESGRHRQTYQLDTNHTDWEDIALAPGDTGEERLYVGDFGDNNRSRSVYCLIRFDEPIVPAVSTDIISLAVEVFYFKYPDGKRDSETLIFDWSTGTPYVIERNGSGCRAYKFALPLDPGRSASNPVELILVTRGALLPPTLTGGDASRDGLRVVLRSYTDVFEYARPPGGAFDDIFVSKPCRLGSAGSQQYEAITYGAGGDVLYTTTERAGRSASPILVCRAAAGSGEAFLKGAPTSAGLYELELEVKDSSGLAARRAFRIEVRPKSDPPPGALPGDCNQSGSLDIADAICLLDLLFAANMVESPCDDVESETDWLDFNGDTDLDISDVLALLIHVFGEGPGHALASDCFVLAGCSGQCGPDRG